MPKALRGAGSVRSHAHSSASVIAGKAPSMSELVEAGSRATPTFSPAKYRVVPKRPVRATSSMSLPRGRTPPRTAKTAMKMIVASPKRTRPNEKGPKLS